LGITHPPFAYASSLGDGAAKSKARTRTSGIEAIRLFEDRLLLELRPGTLNVMRFTDPEQSRTLGLAWCRTSPRKRDSVRLGQLIEAARTQPAA
jgi:LysR family hydrogen peroxide-inducible transcriptional activator